MAVLWVLGMLLFSAVGGDKGGVASGTAAPPPSCGFPAIYNFGDDNSDTGAHAAAYDDVDLPNGQTFFGKPSGRYCDGRLIIDFIAEHLGLPFLSAYVDSCGSNFSHGANFAFADQTIISQPFNLGRQHLQFLQFKSRTTALYNQLNNHQSKEDALLKSHLPRPEDFSKALYIIEIGENDFVASTPMRTRYPIPFFSDPTAEKVRNDIPALIEQLSKLLANLHEIEGARFFWIHNVGPTGCSPYSVKTCQKKNPGCGLDPNGCVKDWNQAVQDFNKQLKDAVVKARAKYPKATFVYVDIYSAKYNLISQAKNLDFKDPMKLCCGNFYDVYVPCGQRDLDGTTLGSNTACKDPSKYISWDGIHYTEAANQFLAKLILNGSFSNPSVSLAEACLKS